MDFEKLQYDINELIKDWEVSDLETEEIAKDIADLVMRRMDIPDTHVMKMADQAMEIDRLKARIAELEEKLRWIPVEERLPEVEKLYLVKGHLTRHINDKIRECVFYNGKFQTAYYIAYWMEVPEL